MDKYYEFDPAAVQAALTAAQSHNESFGVASAADAGKGGIGLAAGGEFFVAAQCISVTVRNHKVCLSVPLIGQVCLPIPINIGNGTVAQACLGICTTWGFPTGVRVTISIGGNVIVRKTFGRC